MTNKTPIVTAILIVHPNPLDDGHELVLGRLVEPGRVVSDWGHHWSVYDETVRRAPLYAKAVHLFREWKFRRGLR